MRSRTPFRLFQICLVFAAILFFSAGLRKDCVLYAQKTELAQKPDFSQTNWDDESEEGGENEASLSGVNWDDESEEENSGTNDFRDIEAKEKKMQVIGFFIFIFYVIGGAYTAYLTRNRKIAVQTPPEILILMHTLWPLELLLLPFFGKKMR